jgi:hypothetical protein
MNQPNQTFLLAYWFVFMLVGVSAVGFLVFSSADGPTKRRVFRWYTVVGGILIAGWFTMLLGMLGFVVAIALLAVTIPLSLRTTRFCDACGATMFNQFMPAKFCRRCGADLDAQDTARRQSDNSSV